MTQKLLVIVGITGNQGGSVASAFLSSPHYRIRGLTRNPSSPTAQRLSSQGIEIVAADLDDPASLEKAFEGASLIFSVTNYWEPFFRPDCRAKAEEKGISCREYAYEVEYSTLLSFRIFLNEEIMRMKRYMNFLLRVGLILLQDKERI